MPRSHVRPSLSISLAACALSLPEPGDSNVIRMQLLPAGEFRPQDGRAMDVPYWYVDQAAASALIARAKSRATRICIDYEHQTLHKEKNGQPAPAAAWVDNQSLEWVEGEGVYGLVELTARAREAIAAREYLYYSPVFVFDTRSGAVLDLKLGALTNLPAIDGLAPLTAQAAATFAADMAALSQVLTATQEEQHMDELLEQLRWMLNLPVGATADDIKAQLQKLMDQIKTTNADAVAAASFDLTAHLAAQHAQVAALSAQVAAPDPARFAPVAIVAELQGQVAALSAQLNTGKVEELIAQAKTAGKLSPAMESWARDLGKTNLAALSQFIESAPAIAALGGIQSGGSAPPATTKSATDTQLAVCKQLGLTPEEFAKGAI